MGWVIAAATLLALGCLPLGVRVRYDRSGMELRIVAGFLKLRIGRKKPKKAKPKKEKAKASPSKAEKPNSPPPEPKKKGGSLLDFLPLAKVGLALLNDFRRKLRVDRLELRMVMAGGDPAKLAVNYGRLCASAGAAQEILDRALHIKKKEIDLQCDFVAPSTTVYALLELTITLGRLLFLLIRYGWKALKEYLKIKNKRESGAENEPKHS